MSSKVRIWDFCAGTSEVWKLIFGQIVVQNYDLELIKYLLAEYDWSESRKNKVFQNFWFQNQKNKEYEVAWMPKNECLVIFCKKLVFHKEIRCCSEN